MTLCKIPIVIPIEEKYLPSETKEYKFIYFSKFLAVTGFYYDFESYDWGFVEISLMVYEEKVLQPKLF